MWGVHLTQKLFDPAMIPGLQIAYRYREIAELGLQQTREQIAKVVAELYLTLLYLKEQKKLLNEEKKALQKEIERTDEEINLGLQPEWSRIRIRLQIQRYEKEVIALRSTIENIRRELFRLTGSSFDVVEPPQPPEEIPAIALSDLESSTTLKLMNVNLELANLMKKVKIGRFFPRIDFIWDYSNQDRPGAFARKENWYVMLKLSWTIFSGGSRFFLLKQSAIDEEVASLKLEREKKEKEIKMKKLVDEYRNLVKLLDITRDSLKLAETNFRMVEESYHLGKTDIISYLDARSNLIKARATLLRVRNQLILKRMELYTEAGKLEQFLQELER